LKLPKKPCIESIKDAAAAAAAAAADTDAASQLLPRPLLVLGCATDLHRQRQAVDY
jgi:hypothetical protein